MERTAAVQIPTVVKVAEKDCDYCCLLNLIDVSFLRGKITRRNQIKLHTDSVSAAASSGSEKKTVVQ